MAKNTVTGALVAGTIAALVLMPPVGLLGVLVTTAWIGKAHSDKIANMSTPAKAGVALAAGILAGPVGLLAAGAMFAVAGRAKKSRGNVDTSQQEAPAPVASSVQCSDEEKEKIKSMFHKVTVELSNLISPSPSPNNQSKSDNLSK